MTEKEKQLRAYIDNIFKSQWSIREGQVVPEPKDLTLGNDAVHFDRATILYADLTGSTKLVESKSWQYAAEIYKTYLYCASTIIRDHGGSITSYDGDRVMGLFVGKSQTTPAAKVALKLNYAVRNVINPALHAQYGSGYNVKQVVGIDSSELRATRTGVRGDNDLVWVGRAANYAAKLTELKLDERSWITADAYSFVLDEAKFGGSPRREMWKRYSWTQMNNIPIYGSTWWWEV